MLAEFLIDESYDKLNLTDWSSLPLNQKKLKLFEVLGFYDQRLYSKKMKDSISHFGADPSTRIPENDLSKNYKFNTERHKIIKQSINEWKEQLAKAEKEKKTIKYNSHNRKLKIPIDNNSDQNKTAEAQKEHSLAKRVNEEIYNKNNFNTQHRKSAEVLKPLTLEKLTEMNPKELAKIDKDFDLADLLSISSEDEINDFVKNTSLNARFNNVVAKSMSEKTLERAKELEALNKRNEDFKIQSLMKISDNYYDKASAYSKKFKKY